jgi:hypothetical protein
MNGAWGRAPRGSAGLPAIDRRPSAVCKECVRGKVKRLGASAAQRSENPFASHRGTITLTGEDEREVGRRVRLCRQGAKGAPCVAKTARRGCWGVGCRDGEPGGGCAGERARFRVRIQIRNAARGFPRRICSQDRYCGFEFGTVPRGAPEAKTAGSRPGGRLRTAGRRGRLLRRSGGRRGVGRGRGRRRARRSGDNSTGC